MKLKLAQKLKDNGFPQEGPADNTECTICNDCSCCCSDWKGHEHAYVKFPFVEDLIEEIGKEGLNMAYGGVWRSVKEIGFDFENKKFIHKKADGETLEESLSKLWLKIKNYENTRNRNNM